MEDYDPFALLEPTPLLSQTIDRMHDLEELRRSVDWSYLLEKTPNHAIPIGVGIEQDGSPWMHYITRASTGKWEPLKILYEKPIQIPEHLEWKDCFLLIPQFEEPYSKMMADKFMKSIMF